MNKSLRKILKHRKSYHSQDGEDGIVEYILEQLPHASKWCVEFGAWDGQYLSNTLHFVSGKGFSSVLIEADPIKFETLKERMKPYSNCYCINALVEDSGPNRLDLLLSKTPIPKSFDLLSIDIDGDDYYVWESIKYYTPSVVVIEINLRNKPDVERINIKGSELIGGISGTSILSMTKLAKKKGYSLIAQIGCNAIYVKKEFSKLFYENEPSPSDVFLYEGHKMYELNYEEVETLGLLKVLIWFLKKKLYKPIAFWRSNWEKNK